MQIFFFFWRGIEESYLASVHRTMTLKSGLEQQGQTILNFHFFNCYINDWNSVPNSAMSASSLNSFNTQLLNYPCNIIGDELLLNFGVKFQR